MKGRWHIKYGREEISITALESDYKNQFTTSGNKYPSGLAHFIKRRISVSVSLDPLSLSKCLFERFPKRQRTVFRRVVVINVEIAFAFQLERHAAVLCERCKHLHHVNQLLSFLLHSSLEWGQLKWEQGEAGETRVVHTYMIKEPDTGADIDLLLGDTRDMVEINRARDMCLARGPFHRGNTFRHGVCKMKSKRMLMRMRRNNNTRLQSGRRVKACKGYRDGREKKGESRNVHVDIAWQVAALPATVIRRRAGALI